MPSIASLGARSLQLRGVVQGVGFRPFVFRLARYHGLAGWVLNTGDGVRIYVEGPENALAAFTQQLRAQAPPASRIDALEVSSADVSGCNGFEIRDSSRHERPSVRITPDLSMCDACCAELLDPADRRHGYPYINCTNCGPRFSILLSLPYDRAATTMKDWAMCAACEREYHDPADRRFHAQPIACPSCGPHYVLVAAGCETGSRSDTAAVGEAVHLLRTGKILAVKGIGGYHLACDAAAPGAVSELRKRKFRKERPFALMVGSLAVARRLVDLSAEAEVVLTSAARPVVLAPARVTLADIAPDNHDLGVMLPYTPLHYLLFAAGAPEVLVMTSANRSSEPIAYRDDEAFKRLAGIADAFLCGERPIARRVDDSVMRLGTLGPVVLRRARGYAPGTVGRLPIRTPLLAVGADLKNAVTLVVNGEAVVSQHVGDLEHYDAYQAFQETVRDLMTMYEVEQEQLVVAHDLHPQYVSTSYALALAVPARRAVQHHRAHVASVLAERGELDRRVVGVALDGTGCGDDGAIWGGEVFVGSVSAGFDRVAHLRAAVLPGGDAAARYPVQAAAGFLAGLDGLPDLTASPFRFPERYRQARALLDKGVRTFPTTSVGRLFDAVAALLGFTREITFEGQAAIWLEHLARGGTPSIEPFPAPFRERELDFRPLLVAAIEARQRGRSVADIARAFHRGLAWGIREAILTAAEEYGSDVAVLSGGVFQNELLVAELRSCLETERVEFWLNREVPPNDGGISLGQAALAALAVGRERGCGVASDEAV